MTKEIIIKSYVNYDGILTQDERQKILKRIESAFGWLGASIPEEIELQGVKYRLREEIRNLVLKDELTEAESVQIKKLISSLEAEGKFLKNIVMTEDISDFEAMDLSEKILGILRAVRNLREIIRKVPKSEALDAKEELMIEIEDEKRWLKYVKKIK